MEKQAADELEAIAGIDNKRQVSACTCSCSFFNGRHLPPISSHRQRQNTLLLVYIQAPRDWDVTYSYNHWANEGTSLQYITKIILPFIEQKLKLSATQPTLILFDHIKGKLWMHAEWLQLTLSMDTQIITTEQDYNKARGSHVTQPCFQLLESI